MKTATDLYHDLPPPYTAVMAQTNRPTRMSGAMSDDEGGPTADPTDTTGLLLERLQAWKHMCGYLENYIADVAKDQRSQSRDQEKILKGLSHPLRESHHFDQALGGVSGLFENLRANSQAQSNLHIDTEKNLRTQVLPILEKLHAEIKDKNKELTSGAGKSSKAVESARQASQKHIELLGQHTAVADSTGGRVEARNDPYVLQRGVHHRLNKQIHEENNTKSDILAVQNSFQQFEAHVLTTVQAALNTYQQFMSGQADRQKAMYGDMASTAQNIPLDFEWNGFVKRNGHILVSPNTPPRSMDNVSFPNQNHRATQALIEGTLDRKGKGISAISGYSSGYYVVTPAGYLHEFKDDDNFKKDPSPEVSLYLADCTVGALDGVKFAVKGKDTSGGKLGSKMSINTDYNFKAHTPGDAQQWHSIISSLAGISSGSTPISPVDTRNEYERPSVNTGAQGGQTQGVVGQHQSPMSAGSGPRSAGTEPVSATSEKSHGGLMSKFKRDKS